MCDVRAASAHMVAWKPVTQRGAPGGSPAGRAAVWARLLFLSAHLSFLRNVWCPPSQTAHSAMQPCYTRDAVLTGERKQLAGQTARGKRTESSKSRDNSTRWTQLGPTHSRGHRILCHWVGVRPTRSAAPDGRQAVCGRRARCAGRSCRELRQQGGGQPLQPGVWDTIFRS
jgi:hypothetical protein